MNVCRVLQVYGGERIIWPGWLNTDYFRVPCAELMRRPLPWPQGMRLGDVATVTERIAGGLPEPQLIVDGATQRWHGLGKGWSRGELRIQGMAGDEVGSLMTSGTIRVAGNVQAGAGAGMSGGTLRIEGTAGDYLGGPWGNRPWQGGTIIAKGAGAYAAFAGRRGLLIVDEAGDQLGALMRAGTIVVKRFLSLGRGIRRGSIVTFSPIKPPPFFRPSGILVSSYLDLLRFTLRQYDRNWLDSLQVTERFVGDSGDLGKGEILLCR